jgi:hypothetical protein
MFKIQKIGNTTRHNNILEYSKVSKKNSSVTTNILKTREIELRPSEVATANV